MRTENIPVLIVGGGLAGLSTAAFLAWRGFPAVVVERHPGSSAHPRAIGYTIRTTEMLRPLGLEPSLPPAKIGAGVRRIHAESLTGQWGDEIPWSPQKQSPIEYSPCAGVGLAQDRLEPILREKAIELGADVRLSTQLLSFTQDDDGVLATLRGPDGVEYRIRAEYLVAADGHRSPVREALGIPRSGQGYQRTSRSVLFRAPLQEYLDKGVTQFELAQPGFSAFLTAYGEGRWLLVLHEDIDRTDEELRELVERAIGRPEPELEILASGRWEVNAAIAERYSEGRVFLAGDAAHTLPASRGGYGASTGIEDAHNLAWKLAAVLSGESSPSLLDTYDAERRPVAWLCHDQLFARADNGNVAEAPILDDSAMALGLLYRSGAVLGAGPDLPPAGRPDEWAGQPGTRAPHLWLDRDRGLSTVDLLQHGWVLLTASASWAGTDVPVDVQLVSHENFASAYGLADGGAALIRPDGYVAWRSVDLPADPAAALAGAFAQASAATRHATV